MLSINIELTVEPDVFMNCVLRQLSTREEGGRKEFACVRGGEGRGGGGWSLHVCELERDEQSDRV